MQVSCRAALVPRLFVCPAVVALLLCISPACLAASPLPEEPFAILADGRRVVARVDGVTAQGEWVFDQAGETIIVPKDQLVLWGTCRDRCDDSWVVLDDGSLLTADLLRIEEDKVVVAGGIWPETHLPRTLVRGILFRPPLNDAARDALVFRVLSEPRDEDRLLLDHGDELRGAVPRSVSPEPGAFHPEKIAWPVKGSLEPIEVSFKRIDAILFAANGEESLSRDSVQQWIGLTDGSRLLATHVAATEDSLTFEVSAGAKLVAEVSGGTEANPWDRVSFVQPLGTGIAYLSDMQPVGYKHIPYLASSWPYRNDRSVSGGQPRSSWGLAMKGIGMHSSSRLAYDLPETARELHGELAIDQRAGQGGSVVFRVYLEEGEGKWNKAFESGIVRGGQRPVAMRVELKNAVRVALIVDFADRADQWDHANWLNLRLVP